jgi:hypothetical protein
MQYAITSNVSRHAVRKASSSEFSAIDFEHSENPSSSFSHDPTSASNSACRPSNTGVVEGACVDVAEGVSVDWLAPMRAAYCGLAADDVSHSKSVNPSI